MSRTTLTLYFDVLKNELGGMGRRVLGERLARDVGTGDIGLGRFPGQGWSLTKCPFFQRRPKSNCALVAWACLLREQSMVTRWGLLRAGWVSAALRAVPAGPSGCSVDAVLHAHSEVGPALSRGLSRPRLV
jgi:hypothetical protein